MQKFDGPFRHLGTDEKARQLDAAHAVLEQLGALWVFGYGSLMWRPCYSFTEHRRGQLPGFARRLCIWTVEARGTPECPGLGLGLDARPDTNCEGIVHRIAEAEQEPALRALWEREMLTGIYRPEWVTIDTQEGAVTALSFVANPAHPQYAGAQSVQWQAQRVASAVGGLGSCFEYVERTVEAMNSMGVHDSHLQLVLDEARRLVRDMSGALHDDEAIGEP